MKYCGVGGGFPENLIPISFKILVPAPKNLVHEGLD